MGIPEQHPFPFDPTHGYDLEQLLAVGAPEAPEGFDTFWKGKYDKARAVVPDPQLMPGPETHPDWRVDEIAYTSTDGVRIGGWLLSPKRGRVSRGLVVGHGYGGRDAPDLDLPVSETAVLFPCFRGLSRSAQPPIPDDAALHVLHQIDDAEHYVIGGCVEDLWVSVSVLTALFPDVAGRIGYSGISFGGGLGALAIAQDARIGRGFLEVPTFGNRPLWLSLPATGSAAAVQAYRDSHPEVVDRLRLFDAATAATRITAPMLVAVARFDPAVAPPCQFAVANALRKTRFNEMFMLDAGHFDYAESEAQQALLAEKIRHLFSG